MPEPHEGSVELEHTFSQAHRWLARNGPIDLATSVGPRFEASASIAQRGRHSGQPVIRFKQRGAEFGRSYPCCWGHYHNCNQTRIGMYCAALDESVE